MHVVHRQFIEAAAAGSQRDGLELQRELSALCADRLFLALATVFDRLGPPLQHLTINRIEIDAGRLARSSLEHDLIEVVSSAVEQQVRARLAALPIKSGQQKVRTPQAGADNIADDHDTLRSPQQAVAVALEILLRTGLLPWWYKTGTDKSFAHTVQQTWQTGNGRRLLLAHLTALPGNAAMAQRLVRQFPVDFVRAVAEDLIPQAAQLANPFLDAVAAHQPERLATLQPLVWETVLTTKAGADAAVLEAFSAKLLALSLPLGQAKAIRELLAIQFPKQSNAPELMRATARDRGVTQRHIPPDLESDKGLHLDCAGLVLLHPFLPQLFEALGYVTGDKLNQPFRACGLLHYLASGANHAPEHVLAIPKLLCGLDIQDIAEAPADLTALEMAEADGLLQAVVQHWSALGDTSIDGLRGSFLVRSGRYRTRGDSHQLDIEPQSYDILLGQLPWGLGTVQLPWMKHLLWVEWNR